VSRVRNKKKVMEGDKGVDEQGDIKDEREKGRVTLQKKRGERGRRERYGGLSQFRPLLFVFGSARANQTTGDQNSIPLAYIPFLANSPPLTINFFHSTFLHCIPVHSLVV